VGELQFIVSTGFNSTHPILDPQPCNTAEFSGVGHRQNDADASSATTGNSSKKLDPSAAQ